MQGGMHGHPPHQIKCRLRVLFDTNVFHSFFSNSKMSIVRFRCWNNNTIRCKTEASCVLAWQVCCIILFAYCWVSLLAYNVVKCIIGMRCEMSSIIYKRLKKQQRCHCQTLCTDRLSQWHTRSRDAWWHTSWNNEGNLIAMFGKTTLTLSWRQMTVLYVYFITVFYSTRKYS